MKTPIVAAAFFVFCSSDASARSSFVGPFPWEPGHPEFDAGSSAGAPTEGQTNAALKEHAFDYFTLDCDVQRQSFDENGHPVTESFPDQFHLTINLDAKEYQTIWSGQEYYEVNDLYMVTDQELVLEKKDGATETVERITGRYYHHVESEDSSVFIGIGQCHDGALIEFILPKPTENGTATYFTLKCAGNILIYNEKGELKGNNDGDVTVTINLDSGQYQRVSAQDHSDISKLYRVIGQEVILSRTEDWLDKVDIAYSQYHRYSRDDESTSTATWQCQWRGLIPFIYDLAQ